jgi:hypothetical protein
MSCSTFSPLTNVNITCKRFKSGNTYLIPKETKRGNFKVIKRTFYKNSYTESIRYGFKTWREVETYLIKYANK